MKIHISIIIATYNSEKTIEACLSSIVSQRSDLVEIIIVDGGSNDRTVEIVKGFGSEIDYLISEEDEGIYDAWNKGIKASIGQWIMFVGSDDMLCSGVIEKYESIIPGSKNIDYISGKVQLVDENRKPIRIIGERYNWSKFRAFMNVAHVASLHSRRLYDEFGYYDTKYKICGDYELLLRPKNNLKCLFIDYVVSNMAIGGISYNSISALVEAREAKLKNNSKSLLFIYLDYLWAFLKFKGKRVLRLVR